MYNTRTVPLLPLLLSLKKKRKIRNHTVQAPTQRTRLATITTFLPVFVVWNLYILSSHVSSTDFSTAHSVKRRKNKHGGDASYVCVCAQSMHSIWNDVFIVYCSKGATSIREMSAVTCFVDPTLSLSKPFKRKKKINQ